MLFNIENAWVDDPQQDTINLHFESSCGHLVKTEDVDDRVCISKKCEKIICKECLDWYDEFCEDCFEEVIK